MENFEEKYDALTRENIEFLRRKIEVVEENTNILRRKVEDGLGDLPQRVNWLFTILVAFLLGMVSLAYVAARNYARLETLIEIHFEERQDD